MKLSNEKMAMAALDGSDAPVVLAASRFWKGLIVCDKKAPPKAMLAAIPPLTNPRLLRDILFSLSFLAHDQRIFTLLWKFGKASLTHRDGKRRFPVVPLLPLGEDWPVYLFPALSLWERGDREAVGEGVSGTVETVPFRSPDLNFRNRCFATLKIFMTGY
ncbi:MAG: hypothetical protein ACRD18_06540 [Terriglobia bacterium]